MDSSKIIRELMKEQGLSVRDVAEMLGIKEQSFRNKLNRNNITLDTFVKILNLLHAELQVVKNDGDSFKVYK